MHPPIWIVEFSAFEHATRLVTMVHWLVVHMVIYGNKYKIAITID